MMLIKKQSFGSTNIPFYIVATVFGIILGSVGIARLQFSQNWTSVKCLKQLDMLSFRKVAEVERRLFSRSAQRNLIITAAVGSDLPIMCRFARSVRQSCNACYLAMIVTDATMNNSDYRALADLYSIVYVSSEDYVPTRLKAMKSLIANIHSSRWIIINNYLLSLQNKGEEFDNVFICDSHDTVFQHDVFAHMNNYTSGLYAFMEDVRMTIGTCRINSEWIKVCYSKAELKKLSNKSISCSGTVLGTWSAIMSYLSTMESQILGTAIVCQGVTGSDQGVHNYIVHNNMIPNIPIHYISHEYGFVGTLGYVLWMKRNQFGLVENANGSIYAVIHQWNRSKQMIAQFEREYQLIPADDRDKKN